MSIDVPIEDIKRWIDEEIEEGATFVTVNGSISSEVDNLVLIDTETDQES